MLSRLTWLFWSKVKILGPDDCWEWQGGLFQQGCGKFSTGGRHGLSQKTHRTAWILTHGPIPDGLHVLHKCDNKPCCNPKHLFLGTQQDNMNDKVKKGRQARGENHGRAILDEAKIILIRQDLRTQRVVASDYGVSQRTIGRIKSRKLWGWVK